MLADIFGSSVAKDICTKADLSNRAASLSSSNGNKKKKNQLPVSIMRDTVVTETAKYAGQVVEVKRKVSAGGSSSSAMNKKGTKNKYQSSTSTSLDSALSAITGPTKLNTVTKSSMDWEHYKDETGLGDDLEQAAKNGFLSKKEFLERCDVRRFEKELETRQQEKKK